jgi:hypothetical protein
MVNYLTKGVDYVKHFGMIEKFRVKATGTCANSYDMTVAMHHEFGQLNSNQVITMPF